MSDLRGERRRIVDHPDHFLPTVLEGEGNVEGVVVGKAPSDPANEGKLWQVDIPGGRVVVHEDQLALPGPVCTNSTCEATATRVMVFGMSSSRPCGYVAPYCTEHAEEVERDAGGIPAAGPALAAEVQGISGIRR